MVRPTTSGTGRTLPRPGRSAGDRRPRRVPGPAVLPGVGGHDSCIREAVCDVAAATPPLPPADAEDIVAMLVTLARRARAGARGADHSPAAAEALLDGSAPAGGPGSRPGTGGPTGARPVPGAGWAGEAWAGRNVRQPGLRHAFEFFTDPAARQWLRRQLPALIDARRRLGRHPNVVDLVGVAAAGLAADARRRRDAGPVPGAGIRRRRVAGGLAARPTPPTGRPPAAIPDIMRGVVRAARRPTSGASGTAACPPAAVLLTEPPDVQGEGRRVRPGGVGRRAGERGARRGANLPAAGGGRVGRPGRRPRPRPGGRVRRRRDLVPVAGRAARRARRTISPRRLRDAGRTGGRSGSSASAWPGRAGGSRRPSSWSGQRCPTTCRRGRRRRPGFLNVRTSSASTWARRRGRRHPVAVVAPPPRANVFDSAGVPPAVSPNQLRSERRDLRVDRQFPTPRSLAAKPLRDDACRPIGHTHAAGVSGGTVIRTPDGPPGGRGGWRGRVGRRQAQGVAVDGQLLQVRR